MTNMIKGFKFPTFEEWHSRGKSESIYTFSNTFELTIGYYKVRVGATTVHVDGEYVNYQMSLGCAHTNLFNTYSNIKSFYCENVTDKTIKNLKEWYEQKTKELNEIFKKHIIETYLTEVIT